MIGNILAALAGPVLGNIVQTGIGSVLGQEVGKSMLGKMLAGAGGGLLTSKLLGREDKDNLKDLLKVYISIDLLGFLMVQFFLVQIKIFGHLQELFCSNHF